MNFGINILMVLFTSGNFSFKIFNRNNVFIDKSEFESKYNKTMDIDVMDNTHTIKLGVLTTQWLDMDNYEDGDTL